MVSLVNDRQDAFRRAAAEQRLQIHEAEALLALPADEDMPMGLLAARLDLNPPHATRLVDVLESHDLVERRFHPRDRRVRLVALTAAGTDVKEALAAAAPQLPPPRLCQLSTDEERRLIDLLSGLRQQIDGATANRPQSVSRSL
jgi:DNA-binding MarR family transcriptional regulator